MTQENGKKYITWPTYVTLGLTFVSILVGAIGGVAYTSAQKDDELIEKSRNNAVAIATLQECAKNTNTRLERIEIKIDKLIDAKLDPRIR